MATLEVHGPLFFSSETKHALKLKQSGGAGVVSHLLVAPKAVISPIPLTYALNSLPAEGYAWLSGKGPEYSFLKKAQLLSYGALPIKVMYKRFFFAMRGMSWGEFRGKPKVNAPRMVTMVAIVPPSSFRTAIISKKPLQSTLYLRVGVKRSGILKVNLHETRIEESSGPLTLPMSKKMLKHMGCNVKSFVTLLTTYSGDEIGLAEVDGCKVVLACSEQTRRCERVAVPSR